MFVLLPILVFITIFLLLFGRQRETECNFSDWRGAFLQACVVWGGLVVIFSELLSLLDSLFQFWLVILWGLSFISLGIYGFHKGVFQRALIKIKRAPWLPIGWMDRLVIAMLAVVVILLFAISLVAIPNTTDSLRYHMSRVVHWTQNRSLAHYPTHSQSQNFFPIWAELTILNLRILRGNDQLANLVQWFSMVGSLIGVSKIASTLGAGRRTQLLASAFVVSIPMGILQSTSTQNDYVTAFWLVCLSHFILISKKRELSVFEWRCLALATGLGMLTKAHFYIYAFPLLLWYFVPRLFQRGLQRTFIEVAGFAGLAFIPNSGFWIRNMLTYGSPLGPDWLVTSTIKFHWNPLMWITALIRQLAINFTSTIPKLNSTIISFVGTVQDLLGDNFENFQLVPGWNHEDLAGNPLHMLTVFFTTFIIIFVRRQARVGLALRYAMIVLSSFFLISIVFNFNIYYIRFHLPFFVLWGGIFGVVAYFSDLKNFAYFAAVLLLVSSIPWLLLNRTRNVISYQPYTSLGESVFREPPEYVLLANWNELREPFLNATEAVKSTDCKDVGLKKDSGDIEYPYWWLLEAPQSGIRIEAIDPTAALERYIDPSFSPCAIICSVCDDRDRFHGLERVGDYGAGITLFAGSNYSLDEDG